LVGKNKKGDVKLDKTIYIVIGCDADPDRDYFVGNIQSNSLSWRGLLEGIPRAKEKFVSLTDSDGKPPVFTWNLRADHQVKEVYGAYDFILTEHKDFLLDLEKTGDELAWHPHFWYYDDQRRVWYQNYKDVDWQVTMLEKAYEAYQKVLPGRGKTVRMGWSYHNNRTFDALDRLGVETDISGCPGLKIPPGEHQKRLSNFYDWSTSPTRPYHPSAVDYRREAAPGERSLSILELPNLICRSYFWGMLSGLVLTRKMKDLRQIGYALARPSYMATMPCKAALFKPMLTQMKNDIKQTDYLIYSSLLHPDELIENIHPVYSLENMYGNIKAILELGQKLNVRVRYLRACDIKNIIESENRGEIE
jgi:hypothetical protein